MAVERLIIFVKAPRRGCVKTRLAATAGHDRALEIYRSLVGTVLDNVRGLDDVGLQFTPADALESIVPWLRSGWTAAPQAEGDLGDRLGAAFAAAFAAGAERVAIIGSDCPGVRAHHVREAFERLKRCDLVLGPAMDGGYWLIALRRLDPGLFAGIPWSSDRVLAETLLRAQAGRFSVELLETLSDIDTETDWERWIAAQPEHAVKR